MCGRYYNRKMKQEIAERYRAGKVFDDPLAPDFNIAPTTFQPVIRLERDTGNREMALLRWGLVPFFAKSLADFKGFSTFNARAETIAKAATWREPLKKRRCLIPADGFYEWQAAPAVLTDSLIPSGPKDVEVRTKPSKRKPVKTPFAIILTNGEPMAFAGVWDAWKDKQLGTWLQSFAIITDDSRPAPVHLLRPYGSDAMHATPCNPAVGNVKNNGPEMLEAPLNSA